MIETARTERQKQRRRTLAALLASLLIHLLIILAAFVILSMKPKWVAKLAPKPDLAPAEFTLIPPPEPPKKEKRDFFDSSQGQVSKKAPDKAAFESDQNTVAASQQPAESNEPVPTQEGDKAPGLTLQTKDLNLGPVREPSPPSPQAAARQPQQPRKAPQKQKEPEKETKEVADAKPTPKPTPRPMPKPVDDELALLDPVKPPPPKPKPEPEVRKPEPPSQPSVPRQPGFQPQTRITHLTGGISNRGLASVDAMGTPLGRYKKMLSDAIGSRWYYYVNEMLDLVGIGTVQLQFVVRADGKVESVKVLRNTSNESLASCSVRSIMEAEIPPIPKEISGTLAGGKLEVDYSFTIIGQ